MKVEPRPQKQICLLRGKFLTEKDHKKYRSVVKLFQNGERLPENNSKGGYHKGKDEWI